MSITNARRRVAPSGFQFLDSNYYKGIDNGLNGGTSGTFNSTNANLLIVSAVFYRVTPWDATTFSDSENNTWVFLPLTGNEDRKYNGIAYMAGNIKTSSTHTVSIVPLEHDYFSIAGMAFSGVDEIAPYDKQISDNDTPSPGTLTPAVANELFIAAMSGRNFPTEATVSAGPNYTAVCRIPLTSGATIGLQVAFKIATDASPETQQWSDYSTDKCGVSLTAFRPA